MKKRRNTLGALVLLLALTMAVPAFGEDVVKQEIYLEGACYDPLVLRNGNLLLPCFTKKGPEGNLLDEWDYMAWVVSLAPDGTIAWDRHFGSLPGATVYCRFIELEDGSLVGWAHHSVQQVMQDVWKTTLSPDGEEIDRKQQPIDWPNVHVVQGRYWNIGFNPSTGNREYVFETPPGEALWSISEAQTVQMAFNPVATQEGLLLFGRDAERDNIASVAKVSYGGKLIWRVSIQDRHDRSSLFKAGIEARDGTAVAVGGTKDAQTYMDNKGYAAGISKDGQIRWEREFDLEGDGYAFEDVVEVPQGYCLLYTADRGKKLNFLLLDKMGRERGRREYPLANMDFFLIEFVEWDGQVWVMAEGERDGLDGTLLMRLDMNSLWQPKAEPLDPSR